MDLRKSRSSQLPCVPDDLSSPGSWKEGGVISMWSSPTQRNMMSVGGFFPSPQDGHSPLVNKHGGRSSYSRYNKELLVSLNAVFFFLK